MNADVQREMLCTRKCCSGPVRAILNLEMPLYLCIPVEDYQEQFDVYYFRAHLAAQLLYIFQIEFLKAKTLDLKYCISTKSAAKHHSITSIWVLLGIFT